MSPIIKHLNMVFPDLPLVDSSHSLATFAASIKAMGPELYRRVVLYHPSLNLQYSIVCSQLHHNFSFPYQVNHTDIIKQLSAALVLCELLEHVHLHYLIVPREVNRLGQHKALFKSLLTTLNGAVFEPVQILAVEVGFSWSQKIRDNTIQANWYRILLNRSRRVLNLLNNTSLNSQLLHQFDKTINPYFMHVGWFFHVPRLLSNLFFMAKHTVPGSWMGDNEKSLAWTVRLQCQIQRRWFELGNDLVWVAVGAL
ncbi:MAG: hypothetical protein PSV35_04500, partial [bacterium]|nr:hypothetical protein [bacterium]